MGGRFTRRNHGTGHSYQLDGIKIPGVTTVLGSLAKPALINWAANTAAKFAIDNWAELASEPPSERLDRIATAHRTQNRAAMRTGTRIHTFGWQIAEGRRVDVPAELADSVDAYARFLETWELEPVATELPLCHTGHRYGGTADAFMQSPILGRALLDIKTGKGVFPETALQLAAYRFTNLALYKSGEGDPPPVEAAYVAHVIGDSVELLPVDASEGVWRVFLYLLTVHRWAAGDGSPIGSPLYPEDLAS